jgi:predicted nucleic acid-binding protein
LTVTARGHTGGSTPPFWPQVASPGGRAADLLIAATALAAGMPLYTRNADDFQGLEQILKVVAV